MSLIFDRESIEKGLRRAAEMAKHGTREEPVSYTHLRAHET